MGVHWCQPAMDHPSICMMYWGSHIYCQVAALLPSRQRGPCSGERGVRQHGWKPGTSQHVRCLANQPDEYLVGALDHAARQSGWRCASDGG
jgi:hypothetical protein